MHKPNSTQRRMAQRSGYTHVAVAEVKIDYGAKEVTGLRLTVYRTNHAEPKYWLIDHHYSPINTSPAVEKILTERELDERLGAWCMDYRKLEWARLT